MELLNMIYWLSGFSIFATLSFVGGVCTMSFYVGTIGKKNFVYGWSPA